MQGIVKWYNESKGYGFISVEGGDDVFVHISALHSTEHRSLPEGARVEFEIVDGKRGAQAANVVLL